MKKLYFIIASSLLAVCTAMAATPVATQPAKGQLTPRITTDDIKIASPSEKPAIKPMASPAGEWTKVSTGIWFEGPLAALFSDVDEGQWEIDVYENATTKGWYRIMPYNENSPLSTLMEKIDQTPLDICAVDPDKVYFETWKPYGLREFRTACPEAGFSNRLYGTLKDGVIEMNNCIAYNNNGGWYMSRGNIKIVLDKETYKDYSVSVDAPLCASASTSYLTINKGADVSKVKMTIIEGEYPISGNEALVAKSGYDVTGYAGKNVNFNLPDKHALYSALYVSLDANDNVKASGVKYFFIASDDADNWEDAGEATFNETFLSALFTDVDSENIICTVQKHKTIANYLRLVEPYAKHSLFGSNTAGCSDHKHYIYINATDAAHVYIEPSLTGISINSSFGQAAISTWGFRYTDDVAQGETDNVWGKLEGTTITIPSDNMLLMLDKYSDGKFLSVTSDNDLAIKLPATAITSIDGIEADFSDAPVEYFNLQGMPVSNPTEGQIVIRRQGSTVTKIMK